MQTKGDRHMASWKIKTVVMVSAAALALAGVTPASAVTLGEGDFELSSTTVAAGDSIVVTGGGWGDIVDGHNNAVTVINFETPVPAPSPTGPVGSSGGMGSAGGTTIVKATIPATQGIWTYSLTVPAATPVGSGYNVCVMIKADNGRGDAG